MPVKPLSPHVEDSALQPFLKDNFSPVEYLNAVLPPLSISVNSQASKQRNASSLAEVAAHTQATATQLSASTARLSETLTSMTDDIIRAGSRLAYEVEVLRADAVALSETLNEGLAEDIKLFAPQGLEPTRPEAAVAKAGEASSNQAAEGEHRPERVPLSDEPPDLARLRMLSTVRERLDSVVQVFDQAMQ
jgi:hypothetical protein